MIHIKVEVSMVESIPLSTLPYLKKPSSIVSIYVFGLRIIKYSRFNSKTVFSQLFAKESELLKNLPR